MSACGWRPVLQRYTGFELVHFFGHIAPFKKLNIYQTELLNCFYFFLVLQAATRRAGAFGVDSLWNCPFSLLLLFPFHPAGRASSSTGIRFLRLHLPGRSGKPSQQLIAINATASKKIEEGYCWHACVAIARARDNNAAGTQISRLHLDVGLGVDAAVNHGSASDSHELIGAASQRKIVGAVQNAGKLGRRQPRLCLRVEDSGSPESAGAIPHQCLILLDAGHPCWLRTLQAWVDHNPIVLFIRARMETRCGRGCYFQIQPGGQPVGFKIKKRDFDHQIKRQLRNGSGALCPSSQTA